MEYDLIYLYPYTFPYVEQCKAFCKISMTRTSVQKHKLIKKVDSWNIVKFKIVFNR